MRGSIISSHPNVGCTEPAKLIPSGGSTSQPLRAISEPSLASIGVIEIRCCCFFKQLVLLWLEPSASSGHSLPSARRGRRPPRRRVALRQQRVSAVRFGRVVSSPNSALQLAFVIVNASIVRILHHVILDVAESPKHVIDIDLVESCNLKVKDASFKWSVQEQFLLPRNQIFSKIRAMCIGVIWI